MIRVLHLIRLKSSMKTRPVTVLALLACMIAFGYPRASSSILGPRESTNSTYLRMCCMYLLRARMRTFASFAAFLRGPSKKSRGSCSIKSLRHARTWSKHGKLSQAGVENHSGATGHREQVENSFDRGNAGQQIRVSSSSAS